MSDYQIVKACKNTAFDDKPTYYKAGSFRELTLLVEKLNSDLKSDSEYTYKVRKINHK